MQTNKSFSDYYYDFIYNDSVNGLFDILYQMSYSVIDRLNLIYGMNLITTGAVDFDGKLMEFIIKEPYLPFPSLDKYCHCDLRKNMLHGVYKAYGWNTVCDITDCDLICKLEIALALSKNQNLSLNSDEYGSDCHKLSKLFDKDTDFTVFAKEQIKKVWGIEINENIVEELVYDEYNDYLDDVLIIKNESISNPGDIPDDFFSDLSILGDAIEPYLPAKLIVGSDGYLYMIIRGYYINDGRYNCTTSLSYFLNCEKLTLFHDFVEMT